MPAKTNNLNIDCQYCNVWDKSIFGGVCGAELEQLTTDKSVAIHKRGQVLFSEGSKPTGVFCIHKGKVKIYKQGYNGKEQILYICSAGDVLGYNALISEDNYTLSAVALEDCVVCFIPKAAFVEGIKESENFRKILMKTISQQEALLANMVTGLAQKTVRQRLAAALVMLNDTYTSGAGTEEKPQINLSREDLANIVGTATESLIRLLNTFKDEELVTITGRKISVIDAEGLKKIGHLY